MGLEGLRSHKPNRSPAKRVRFGKEEHWNEREMTFDAKHKKSSQAICSLRRRGGAEALAFSIVTPTVPIPKEYENMTEITDLQWMPVCKCDTNGGLTTICLVGKQVLKEIYKQAKTAGTVYTLP